MNKKRLIAGFALSAATFVMIIAVNMLGNNTNVEINAAKEKNTALESVNVETIEKSVNKTNKLAVSLLDTNTEDALPVEVNADGNTSVIIERNTTVKTTKKKSKKTKKDKEKKHKNQKKITKKNQKLESGYVDGGTYKITGYCECASCCGKSTGITASGTRAKAGRTIAADTSVLPFGTKVVINGHTYTVEDRGGAINGNRIDLFFSSHVKALEWGVRYVKIYIKK